VNSVKRTLLIAFVAASAVGAVGCKKPQPSVDYAEAESLFSTLYASKLDDAYLDPQMAKIEELLGKVPANSRDQAAAAELLRKITTERARVTAENAARKATIDEALKPMAVAFDSTPLAPVPKDEPPPDAGDETPAVDAGATQPETGMSTAEFQRKFSGCFSQGTSVELVGHGLCETYELKDISNCRDRHPGYAAMLVVVGDGKILTLAAKADAVERVRLPDGGLGSMDGGQ
jgi:hypothetical protein